MLLQHLLFWCYHFVFNQKKYYFMSILHCVSIQVQIKRNSITIMFKSKFKHLKNFLTQLLFEYSICREMGTRYSFSAHLLCYLNLLPLVILGLGWFKRQFVKLSSFELTMNIRKEGNTFFISGKSKCS